MVKEETFRIQFYKYQTVKDFVHHSKRAAVRGTGVEKYTTHLTYKIQVAAIQGVGTVNINGNGSDLSGQAYSIRGASTITVMEIAG